MVSLLLFSSGVLLLLQSLFIICFLSVCLSPTYLKSGIIITSLLSLNPKINLLSSITVQYHSSPVYQRLLRGLCLIRSATLFFKIVSHIASSVLYVTVPSCSSFSSILIFYMLPLITASKLIQFIWIYKRLSTPSLTVKSLLNCGLVVLLAACGTSSSAFSQTGSNVLLSMVRRLVGFLLPLVCLRAVFWDRYCSSFTSMIFLQPLNFSVPYLFADDTKCCKAIMSLNDVMSLQTDLHNLSE